MTTFSILMNCYNCEKYLKDAIDSIYQQTYQDWEIVFVDNSSTDRSGEIAKSYDKRLKYYKTDKTIPLGEARNFGLQYCKGEFIAFLDTDDLWLPEKLEIQKREMEKFPDAKMSYTGAIFIDENSQEIGRDLPVAKSGYTFPQQLLRYEINMQSVVLKSNIDISFKDSKEFAPDFDLFMRVASKYRVVVIHQPYIKYRKLANSLTSKKIDRWWIETKETLDSIFNEQPELAERYPYEKKVAYAKVAYYKALYLISINNWREARNELRRVKDVNKRYFTLYLLSFSKSLWRIAHRFK